MAMLLAGFILGCGHTQSTVQKAEQSPKIAQQTGEKAQDAKSTFLQINRAANSRKKEMKQLAKKMLAATKAKDKKGAKAAINQQMTLLNEVHEKVMGLTTTDAEVMTYKTFVVTGLEQLETMLKALTNLIDGKSHADIKKLNQQLKKSTKKGGELERKLMSRFGVR